MTIGEQIPDAQVMVDSADRPQLASSREMIGS